MIITNLYHHGQIEQTPKQILQRASDSNKQPPCSLKRSQERIQLPTKNNVTNSR